jgi:mannosyltransferase
MSSPSDSSAARAAAGAGTATGTLVKTGQQVSASQETRRFDAGPVWARLLPPLVALGLSLCDITGPSFWRDEAGTIAADTRPFGAMIRMLGHVDAVHSAYYIIMWPVVQLLGPGEFVMRLPSALAAAVAAAFVAAIGRRVVSRWVGLAAGMIFAVLPVVSRYGQEARSYEMVVVMATIASYLLIRSFDEGQAGRRRWLIWYGVSLALLGILNLFGLLLIPAHAVTVGLRYRHRHGDRDARQLAIGWLAGAVVAVVICTPLVVLAYQQRAQVAWIANNQSSSGPGTLLALAGSALVTLVVAGVVAVGLLVSSELGGVRRVAWRWQLTELSLPWLILPPALLLGASVISPIYTSRYILICVPAIALLGGMALVALGRVAGPAALVLVVLAGLPAQINVREPYGHYDNIRALDKIVAARARPGDVVLYTNPNAAVFGAAYSYGLGKLPNIAAKQAAIRTGTLAGTFVDLSALRSRLARSSRVWVVEINHCVPQPQMFSLSDVPEGPALAGLPLSFVKIWHEHGDWLFLYQHGGGSQAQATACHGRT